MYLWIKCISTYWISSFIIRLFAISLHGLLALSLNLLDFHCINYTITDSHDYLHFQYIICHWLFCTITWLPALSLDYLQNHRITCTIRDITSTIRWLPELSQNYLYYHWIPALSLDPCSITGFLHCYWIPVLLLHSCIITGFLHCHWIPALLLDSCFISGSLHYYWIPALLLDSCIISGSLPYYWIPALSLDHSHYHIITCIIIGLPVKYQDYWHYHRICTSSFAELSALSWITVTAQSPLSLDYPHHHWITWIFTGLPALSLDYQQ